jgi:hypothetical protein
MFCRSTCTLPPPRYRPRTSSMSKPQLANAKVHPSTGGSYPAPLPTSQRQSSSFNRRLIFGACFASSQSSPLWLANVRMWRRTQIQERILQTATRICSKNHRTVSFPDISLRAAKQTRVRGAPPIAELHGAHAAMDSSTAGAAQPKQPLELPPPW